MMKLVHAGPLRDPVAGRVRYEGVLNCRPNEKRSSAVNTRTIGCLAGALACVVSTTSLGHETLMRFNEVVHSADAIFVGRVVDIECFDTRGLIGTRVTFDAISPITQRDTANTFVNEHVVIEYAGGTINGRTDDVCCQPSFEVGQELLVMTQLDGGRYLNPFAGGRQGLFRLIRDEQGTIWPLTWSHRGLVPEHLASLRQTDPVSHIHEERPFYLDVQGTERVEAPVSTQSSVAITVSGIRPGALLSMDELVSAIATTAASPTPPSIEEIAGPRPAFGPVSKLGPRPMLSPIPAPTSPDIDRGSLCVCGFVNTTHTMEMLSSSWTNPYNDSGWAMNCYDQVFNIFANSPDNGGWGNNGDNEFCGWPTSTDLNNVYGFTWGATTVAACVTSTWCECCRIRESDIFMNPAYTPYYDIDSVIGTTGNRTLYRATVRHELGHAVGFERDACNPETYQYNQPCSMSADASQQVIETGKGMHALDAAGIRAIYGTRSLEDVGAESYQTSGNQISATLDPDSLVQGETFDVEGVTVENISSNSQSGVRCRVYLSTNTTISESDYLVDEFTFSSMPAGSFWAGDFNNVEVPFSVPADAYYVGLIATIDGGSYNWDDYTGNNATYVPQILTVGQGNPWDHWTLSQYFAFNYLSASIYINNLNSSDDGGDECDGEPFLNGVWLRFVGPYSGLLRLVMQGDGSDGLTGQPTCNSFIQVFTNNDGTPGQLIGQGCNTCQNPLDVEILQGGEYFVRVGSLGDATVLGWLNLEVLPPGLPGDEPEFAFPPSSTPQGIDLAGYTPTPLEFTCSQDDIIDAWHIVRAPSFIGNQALMRASTCNANTTMNTTLSVYTATGQRIDCNDNYPCSGNDGIGASTIEWSTSPNQGFYVRVGCSKSDVGSYSLTLEFDGPPPPGDDCDNPIGMQGTQQPFNNWGATTSGATDCMGTPIGADLFMKWSAPEDGWVRIGTCPDIGGLANFDSIVAVYADSCDPESLLGCNDDASNDGTSIVELQVLQGQSYFIQVGVAASDALEHGGGILAIKPFTPDATPCEGDVTGDGITGVEDLLALLDVWGTDDEDADVAPDGGDGIVGVDDLLFVIADWGCE